MKVLLFMLSFIGNSFFFCQGIESNISKADDWRDAIKFRTEDIRKSKFDNRLYRGIELSNGMKIMLVSDRETDKAAAALAVAIGHMMDPDDIPGLAHFCEHMLFLGSKKYPVENEFSKFLSQHGGGSNAYTSTDLTNYYFNVAPENLSEALDRFSQFFLNPLFNEDSTERELNAVHQEHEKNIPVDSWKWAQIERHSSKPGHPYAKFGTGTRQTLWEDTKKKNINLRQALLDFYEKWYSSNIMTVAVVGRESLDALEELVVPVFFQIQNKNLSLVVWKDHAYGPNEVKKLIKMVPVQDINTLRILFPIPDLTEFYRSSPASYLSHLIGHEGKGSLLSHLKLEKQWATSLSAGEMLVARGFGYFSIRIELTEEGMSHLDEAIIFLFQYLAMLRREGPKEWIFRETQQLHEINFLYKDKEETTNYAKNLARYMAVYKLEEILTGPHLLYDYKPELIEMVLGNFTADNIWLTAISKKFMRDDMLVEPWYKTLYSETRLDEKYLQVLRNAPANPKFSLPNPNEFIPTNLEIYPPEAIPLPWVPDNHDQIVIYPILMHKSSLFNFWYKQDLEFFFPKSVLRIHIESSIAYLDPMHANLLYLYTRLLEDSLNEYTYDARLAGLSYSLQGSKRGLIITINGYSEKQELLLERILDKMISCTVNRKRFAILKRSYKKGLKNFQFDQPYVQATYYLKVLLQDKIWTKNHLLAYLDESSHLYAISYDAHRSNGLNTFFQYASVGLERDVILDLFAQILREPFYSILRTKEQLGYIVFTSTMRLNCINGINFIIQSEKEPVYVNSRIENFLEFFEGYLNNMTEQEFENHKMSILIRRLEKPKSLTERFSLLWNEIANQEYNFDRNALEVAAIRSLTLEHLKKFYAVNWVGSGIQIGFPYFQDYVKKGGSHRRRLSVYVVSTEGNVTSGFKNKDETAEYVYDVADFKSSLSLCALRKPFQMIDEFQIESNTR